MASGNQAFFNTLGEWAHGLEDVKDLSDLSQDMARTSQMFMRQGFRTGTAPDGSAWKAKKEPDGRKPLTGETARLSKPWTLHSDRNGFRLSSKVPYARYHQKGSKGGQPIRPKNKKALRFKSGGKTVFSKGVTRGDIPKRKMYPDGPHLPSRWSKAYREDVEDFMSSRLSGRRA